MEQLFSFIATVLISVTALQLNSPPLFLICFIGGLSYHVIRGKKKGWLLPKDIKSTHSW